MGRPSVALLTYLSTVTNSSSSLPLPALIRSVEVQSVVRVA